MNFAEPRTSDPWSWPDNRDEIPRVWNKTTGKMEPIDKPIIMYSSDSENNWNKDPGFGVGGTWDKDPGFSPPVSGRDFLREYLSGGEEYSQFGTDIPSFGISRSYEGGGGTGMEPYFSEQIATTPSFGGNPRQQVPADWVEKMSKPGSPMPAGLREKIFGTPSQDKPDNTLPQARGTVFPTPFDIAGSPSFSIPQGQGALGKRSGEQLKRIQESGIQNEQLQQELQRRGIMPRGIQLPPV
jgi:hypothetical protein